MIPLGIADLVLITGRVLDLDTDAVLELLDIPAAEAALAEAAAEHQQEPARAAAALLHALVRRSPLAHGNEQVALVATTQFLSLNGFHVDLDPPDANLAVILDLAAGRLGLSELREWLAPRLSRRADASPASCDNRPMLLRWLPRKRRRSTSTGPFDRFTDRARTAVLLAQDESRRLGHNHAGTQHLLLGLLREGTGLAAQVLEMLGITGAAVRHEVEQTVGYGRPTPSGHISFTPRAKKVFDCARREALQLGHHYVGTEHLLLGVLHEGTGQAAQMLVNLGAEHARVREHVMDLLTGARAGRGIEAPELAHYTELITQIRQDKQAAIDAGDFSTAVGLRDTEKRLLIEKQQRLNHLMAGMNTPTVVEENHQLRSEVQRLRALLRHHGIHPDDGPEHTANASH